MNGKTTNSAAPERASNTSTLGKTKPSTTNQVAGHKRLVLLWGILVLGYFLFVVQWYSITNFQGDPNKVATSNAEQVASSVDAEGGTGWGAAFFLGNVPSIESSATNWMITFGRAIGSILAGYLVAKIGHKYAVVTVLGLMVVAFPFIIVAQNSGWNSLSIAGGAPVTPWTATGGDPKTDATAVAGFSLFVLFRTFLAIGGTTLITYTNAIIGRMEQAKRPKFMTLNQFGFNGGAAFASIFFVIPPVAGFAHQQIVWTGILSFFIVLSLILMLTYLFIGTEMVPPKRKQELVVAPNATSFGNVVKQKDTWRLIIVYGIWLISAVFSTSTTLRSWVLPTNFSIDNVTGQALYRQHLSGMETTNLWNMFTFMFLIGFFAAMLCVTRFGKTIFERRTIMHVMIGFGYVSLLIAYLCGKYSYAQPVPIAFMMVFGFISGFFLWGIQAVFLTIPQQMDKSTPEYVGILAGLVWGFGYLFYTFGDMILNLINTFVPNRVANTGSDAMLIVFWVILVAVFVFIPFLPKAGYKKQDGTFVYFDKQWNPLKLSHWNTSNEEFLISTHAGK